MTINSQDEFTIKQFISDGSYNIAADDVSIFFNFFLNFFFEENKA